MNVPDMLMPSAPIARPDGITTKEWYDWFSQFRLAMMSTSTAAPATNFAHSTFFLAEQILDSLGTPLVNDNAASDQNAKLQSAINYVAARTTGGGTLFLPPWTIGFAAGLTIPSGVRLKGQGPGLLYKVGAGTLNWGRTAWGTRLKNIGSATGTTPLIRTYNGTTDNVQSPGIESLSIDGGAPDWRSTPGSSAGAPTASHRPAIRLSNSWGSTVRDVDITFAGDGLSFQMEEGTNFAGIIVESHVENVRIANVWRGVVFAGYLGAGPPGAATADTRLYNVYVWDAERAALDIVKHTDNVWHFGCDYRANGPGTSGAAAIMFNSSGESPSTTNTYQIFYGCECVGASKPSGPGQWANDPAAGMIVSDVNEHCFVWDGGWPVGTISGAGALKQWYRNAGRSATVHEFSLWTGNRVPGPKTSAHNPLNFACMTRINMTDYVDPDLATSGLQNPFPFMIKKAEVYVKWLPATSSDVFYVTNPDTGDVMASDPVVTPGAVQEHVLNVLPYVVAHYWNVTNAGFQAETSGDGSTDASTGPQVDKAVLRIRYTGI